MKKVINLADKRGCGGGTVRELRSLLSAIGEGDIVSLSFVAVRRDGVLRIYNDNDCRIRAVGAVEVLKSTLIEDKFLAWSKRE